MLSWVVHDILCITSGPGLGLHVLLYSEQIVRLFRVFANRVHICNTRTLKGLLQKKVKYLTKVRDSADWPESSFFTDSCS